MNLLNKKDKDKNKNASKHISPLEMYTRTIERRFRADTSKIDLRVYGDAKMRITYDKVITSSSIRKYFILTNIARYMPTDLFALLRTIETDVNQSEDSGEFMAEGVNVNFNLKMEPHRIEWSNRIMQIRAQQWEQDMNDAEQQMSHNRLVSDQELAVEKQNSWLQESWRYFKEACGRGRSTPVVSMVIELCTTTATRKALDLLQIAELSLYDKCITKDIIVKPIRGNLWDFLKWFSPVSTGNTRLDATMPKFPMTDEIISNFTDYTPGKLSGTEVLIGYDLDTSKFVYKNFVDKLGGAETLVISAVTGGGKSFFCKSIVINMLLAGYSVCVMDRDGEYIPLCDEIGGTVISMSQGSGRYFDSTEIADLTGDTESDKSLLIESQITTKAVFNAIADTEKGMNAAEEAIFNDAYNKMYADYGIDKTDMSTWHNSKKLSYHLLYKYITDYRYNEKYIKRYGDELLTFIDKLRTYFTPKGINSYLFKERISIREVYHNLDGAAPMVVLHMDLHDEGGNVNMDKASVLKLLTTSYLSNMILSYNKKKHRFTLDIVEEFQRYLYNDIAKGITVTKATGNRKRNAITCIITNNPGELASAMTDDRSLDAIRANITSSMIGKIQSLDDIVPICRNLGLYNCESELRTMFEDPVTHRHAFIAKFDGMEAAMVKAVVPPSLLDTPVFKTRDTEKAESSLDKDDYDTTKYGIYENKEYEV